MDPAQNKQKHIKFDGEIVDIKCYACGNWFDSKRNPGKVFCSAPCKENHDYVTITL